MKMTQVSLNENFILSSGFSTYVSMKKTQVSLNKGFILSPATDSLKVLSRKRRRKCTQSCDRFTNS